MILAGLHCCLFAVQLGSRVDSRAKAELIDEFADVLHLAAAEVHVVIAEVRNREAFFEGQAVEESANDHGLMDLVASGGRPTVP